MMSQLTVKWWIKKYEPKQQGSIYIFMRLPGPPCPLATCQYCPRPAVTQPSNSWRWLAGQPAGRIRPTSHHFRPHSKSLTTDAQLILSRTCRKCFQAHIKPFKFYWGTDDFLVTLFKVCDRWKFGRWCICLYIANYYGVNGKQKHCFCYHEVKHEPSNATIPFCSGFDQIIPVLR